MADCGRLDEPVVHDPGLIAPEIVAAQVAESEPHARMHRIVIRRIHVRHRWMVAGDLDSAGRVDVGEERPQDLVVAKHVGRNRPATIGDEHAIGLLVDGEIGGDDPVAGEAGGSAAKYKYQRRDEETVFEKVVCCESHESAPFGTAQCPP